MGNLRRAVGGDEIGDEAVPKGVKIDDPPHSVFRFEMVALLAICPFLWVGRFVRVSTEGRASSPSNPPLPPWGD